jgi:hypothetical protein
MQVHCKRDTEADREADHESRPAVEYLARPGALLRDVFVVATQRPD